jgi:4-diphosphocytidyl-2-C-methyl-D-erythritol kinase
MVVFPNAKINLGLQILHKRPDGFHNLASVFCPVGWCDALEVLPADTLSFKSTGIPIPGGGDNLCLKAYRLLAADFNIPPVYIHLHKHIPIGAGLGGGSADAAFTLKALNELFELGLKEEELEAYCRALGSDCAFFIRNKPVLAIGKGDEFEPLTLSLDKYHIVVVYPAIHVSTAEAYSGVKPAQPGYTLPQLLAEDPSAWKSGIKNDFEDSIFPKYPAIARLKEMLYEQGAVYASMSGSGSAVYGLFKEPVTGLRFPDEYTTWTGAL